MILNFSFCPHTNTPTGWANLTDNVNQSLRLISSMVWFHTTDEHQHRNVNFEEINENILTLLDDKTEFLQSHKK
jgi:hypothetical protein